MRTHKLHGFYRSIKQPALVPGNGDNSQETPLDEIRCATDHDAPLANGCVNGKFNGNLDGHVKGNVNGAVKDHRSSISASRLLIWSAADESAMYRTLQAYDQYYSINIAGRRHKLDQLAYTLAARRSVMSWRSFAVIKGNDDAPHPEVTDESSAETSKSLPTEKPLRVTAGKKDVAFVFTGQGAQYPGMGLELMRYSAFADSLRRSDEILGSLGCEWSLFGESSSSLRYSHIGFLYQVYGFVANVSTDAINDKEKISTPEYSQPLCTALQIALVDLSRNFNIVPAAVVGHSSGEIAAAYTVGALTHESACKSAYFRGKLAGRLASQIGEAGTPGAMLSANIREDEVQNYLESLDLGASDGTSVCLACVNSPSNVTLAGPADQVNLVKADLDKKDVFAQKLNTGVAYHSPAMRAIAEEYADSIGPLKAGSQHASISMVSSVTGKVVEPEVLATPQYWVDNLTSPVQFVKALSVFDCPVKSLTINDMVEIGPHAALRRPVKDTVPQLRYHAWIQRSAPALQSTLHLAGRLFCLGFPVSITTVNGQDQGNHPYLVDCPAYPFDHSRRYWDESRISRDWRLREASSGFLLGRRTHDWNPLKPRWRNWLCVETIPWLGEHYVSKYLLPT